MSDIFRTNWRRRFWHFFNPIRTQRRPRQPALQIDFLEERITPATMAQPNFVLFSTNHTLEPAGSTGPTGTFPSFMRSAYGVSATMFGSVVGDGTGQTIAIIDAYNQPNIISDLTAFDTQFSLAAPPSFTVLNQTGGASLPSNATSGNWGVEISLDVEWAHVIAPRASIVLFEANSSSLNDLFTAVDTARNMSGVSVVSMSFGGDESAGVTSLDSHFTTPSGHSGVTFVASTGDKGAYSESSGSVIVPEYPADSVNVVAVGGTTLTVGSGGSYMSEIGWGNGTNSYSLGGSGGGISSYEPQPSYQAGKVSVATSFRTTPDVSMDADPGTGVPFYDSYDNGASAPWGQVGGTSLAAPMWAGIIAIANQGRVLNGLPTLDGPTVTLPDLYNLPPAALHDVVSGNNYYAAGPGYDLVTGLGSPVANLVAGNLAQDTDYADTRWAGLANGTVIADADPVTPGNQPAVIGVNAFASVNAAIAAATAAGTTNVVVNGDDSSGLYGNFNESVNVNPYIKLTVQYGPVSLNSLTDSNTNSSVELNGVALTVGSDSTSTQVIAPISGAGSLIKVGSGTLTLAGTDTFSGTTTVSGGVLMAGGATALSNLSAVTVNGGATLRLDGFSSSIGSLTGSGTVENDVSTTATLTVGGLNTSTRYTGTLQDGTAGGSLSLIKVGSGNLTLAGTNTYTGTTAINGGDLLLDTGGSESGTSTISGGNGGLLGGLGTITAASISATLSPGLSSGSTGTLNASNLNLIAGSNYVVDLNSSTSFDQINVTGTVTLSGAALTVNANYSAAAGDSYTIINNDGTDPIIGTFNNLPEGAIIHVGSQEFRISYVGGDGNDVTLTEYTPSTIYVEASWSSLSPGTVIADADPETPGNQPATYGTNAFSTVTAALATANPGDFIVVNSGSYNEDVLVNKQVTLTLQQGAISFNSLADTTPLSTVNLSGISLTVGSDNASTTFSSSITGTGSLIKVGAGTQILAGGDTFSGGVTISSGILELGAAGVFTGQSPISVSGGSIFRLHGFNAAIGSLSGSGSIDNTSATPAKLTVGALNTSSTFSGVLADGAGTGSLSLVKTGTGTLTLSNANSSYTGTTQINGGNLSVATLANGGSNSSIGAASNSAVNLILGGGTLLYTGGTVSIDRGFTLTGASTLSVATVMSGAATLSTSGTEIGGYALTTAGPGSLAFTTPGALDNLGGLTVSSGTLFATGQTLSATLVLTIRSGAVFNSTGTLTLLPSALQSVTLVNGNGLLQLGNATSSVSNPDISYDSQPGDFNDSAAIATTVSLGSNTRYIQVYSNNNILGVGGDLEFNAPISGTSSSGLVISGVNNGSVLPVTILQAANPAFSGSVTLDSGELVLNSTSALSKSNALTLNPSSGATSAVYLNGNTVSIGSLSTASSTGTAEIRNGSSSSATLKVAQGINAVFAGIMSDGPDDSGNSTIGSLALTLVASSVGSLILTGTNTYSGGTTINGGNLQVGNGGTAGSVPGNIVDNATLTTDYSGNSTGSGIISGTGKLVQAGSGTLTITAIDSYTGGTLISAGGLQLGNGGSSGSIAGNVTDNAIFEFDFAGTVTFAGVISGSGTLMQVGSGTTVLTGTNTYSGGTTINTGALQIGNGGAAGSLTGNVTDNGSLIVDLSISIAMNGVISGNGNFIQAGAGTTTLAAVNTYSGGTVITGGILSVGLDTNLGVAPANATAGNLAIRGGTLLGTSSFVLNANRGIAVGPSSGSGSGEIDVLSGQTLTYAGTITNFGTGTGTLVIDSAGNTGALVLSGNNSYSGPTTVQAGTLLVTGSLNTNSAITVGSAATLGGNHGIVGPAFVSGHLAPGGPGQLTTGQLSLASGSSFNVVIDGTSAGVGYDQIVDTSSSGVNLSNNPTLNVTVGIAAAPGAQFTIIQNQGHGAVAGNFSGPGGILTEGSIFTVGSQQFVITYLGGSSGHDVVLTAITPTSTMITANPVGPINQGMPVTFTATVSGNPSVGTVTFYTGPGLTNAIGTAIAVSGGVATSAASTSLPVGSDIITAVYSGGTGLEGSQGTTTIQVVNPITISSIAVNSGTSPILAASESGNIVTINTDGLHGYAAGDPVVIAGVGSGYNGSYTIASASASSNSFTINFGSITGLTPVTDSGTAIDTVDSGGLLINSAAPATSQRSMVDSIVYKFNQGVNLAAGAFTIAPAGNNPGTLPSLSYSSPDGGVTWVVTFYGTGVVGNSIANGEYQIVLNNSAVASASGAGVLSNSDTETLYRLFGDTSGNGHERVSAPDRNAFNGTFGATSTNASFLAYLDWNGDGRVSAPDRNAFNGSFGLNYGGFTPTI